MLANRADPDQMPHHVQASHLGLHSALFAYDPFTSFQVRMG